MGGVPPVVDLWPREQLFRSVGTYAGFGFLANVVDDRVLLDCYAPQRHTIPSFTPRWLH